MIAYEPQNFAMVAPVNGLSGNVTLPPPSLAAIAVTNGIGLVAAQDVRTALRAGWQLQAGQNWPAAEAFRMAIPSGVDGENVPANTSTFTLPDGVTQLTISNGVAIVPKAWRNYLIEQGWADTAA